MTLTTTSLAPVALKQTGQNLAVLRELAAWRDVEARASNTMHTLIIRDELMVAFAEMLPSRIADLRSIQGIKEQFLQRCVVVL